MGGPFVGLAIFYIRWQPVQQSVSVRNLRKSLAAALDSLRLRTALRLYRKEQSDGALCGGEIRGGARA